MKPMPLVLLLAGTLLLSGCASTPSPTTPTALTSSPPTSTQSETMFTTVDDNVTLYGIDELHAALTGDWKAIASIEGDRLVREHNLSTSGAFAAKAYYTLEILPPSYEFKGAIVDRSSTCVFYNLTSYQGEPAELNADKISLEWWYLENSETSLEFRDSFISTMKMQEYQDTGMYYYGYSSSARGQSESTTKIGVTWAEGSLCFYAQFPGRLGLETILEICGSRMEVKLG